MTEHLLIQILLKKIPKKDKHIIKERKQQIQSGLKEKLGILVDMPKQNFGNTDDGNTGRRVFSDVDIVSEVTGTSIKISR